MASKGEKAKSKKTIEAKNTVDSKKEDNVRIVFEYSKERYNYMIKQKEHIDRNSIYLLLIISISALFLIFNGVGLLYDTTELVISDYLYIGTFVVLILDILILVASLKNTFIKKKVFRYLFKKIYKIDIYKDLELKDKIDDAVKSKEKSYKRKLTRDEKKRGARKTIRESCCYREMDDPVEIMKISKRRYSEKTDKFYEYLIKLISPRINEGNVINKIKQICFNISLGLFIISMILIFINTIVYIYLPI